MKLLNPGPVSLSERVRNALLREDLCHREAEFVTLYERVSSKLRAVDPSTAQSTVTLLAGSGTCAVESMVGSFVGPGAVAVVVENGVYGERIAAMLRAQGKVVRSVRCAWTEPPDLAAVEAALGSGPAALVAVHHETTTGRLNDLHALARLAVRANVPLLVDAVSSFGAEPLPRLPGLRAAFAATANKCLHGVPGACFVLVDEALWAGKSGATSVYLDLFRYRTPGTSGSSLGATPFTPPVHSLHALNEALSEYFELGGLEARRARYARHTARLRTGLGELGSSALVPAGESSVCLTAFSLPSAVSYEALHDFLKREGFVVYAGQGALAGKTLRLAVMGELDDADIERVLILMRQFMQGAR
jgi:2-aminoethylphosphonate-pyruvate transaminase